MNEGFQSGYEMNTVRYKVSGFIIGNQKHTLGTWLVILNLGAYLIEKQLVSNRAGELW